MPQFRSSFAALLLAFSANVTAAPDCTSLAAHLVEQLPDTFINSTTHVAKGDDITIPPIHPSCNVFSQASPYDFCRVQLHQATSSRSGVDVEAWLPSNWTGRFLSTGNGGLGGCISYSDMDYVVVRGFAAVGTNNGHDGNIGEPFYKNPEVMEDYARRAAHVGVSLGKKVTKAFYGREHTKSYWLGCSTGGRQGFVQAQTYPEDFDGIVSGAPALDLVSLLSWSGYPATVTGPPGSSTFLPPDLWQVVIEDTLEQCDELDGHRDGIIEDTDLCQYRPERLICSGHSENNCLTPDQVETVRTLLSPLYGLGGKLIYPRMTPGSDSSQVYWTGKVFEYPLEWWRYMVKDDPKWNGTISLEDIDHALKTQPPGLETWDGNLSRARELDVKILHYHGMEDSLISSEQSDRYYNHVSRTMSQTSDELDAFYRYFRISGLAHCAGGNGASFIGSRPDNFATDDPDGNVLWSLVRWVEEGKAPETILGTAFKNATTRDEIAFQRRHCKYPLRNTYSGTGDPDDADSWNCV